MRLKIRKLYIISAVVAVVFFVVGFFSFTYFFKNSPSSPDLPSISTEENDELALNPNDPPITPFRELHEAILSMPAPDASESARETYRALLEENAVQQNSVTLTDCKPDPIAIVVQAGSDITINNSDDVQHVVTVNVENQVAVPENGSASLTADFGHGNGYYAYRCDQDEAPVGIFLVKGEL